MLDDLKANNRAWAAAKLGADPEVFRRSAQGQTPQYLWIGCADSRVPPNEILGLDIGALFVHRNIANLATPGDASHLSVLQYSVDVLKVKHIIVAGHYGCGGVAASISGQDLGLIGEWLRPIKAVHDDHAEELEALPSEKARLDRLSELNVIRQVANVASSAVVQGAWARGQALSVHGWVYALADGLITDLGVDAENTEGSRRLGDQASPS